MYVGCWTICASKGILAPMSVKVREFLEQPKFGDFDMAFTSETWCDIGSELGLHDQSMICKLQRRKFSFYDMAECIYERKMIIYSRSVRQSGISIIDYSWIWHPTKKWVNSPKVCGDHSKSLSNCNACCEDFFQLIFWLRRPQLLWVHAQWNI